MTEEQAKKLKIGQRILYNSEIVTVDDPSPGYMTFIRYRGDLVLAHMEQIHLIKDKFIEELFE